MMRVAVVGAGSHSRLHGESLRIVRREYPEDLELAAICDLDAEKADAYRREFGFHSTFADAGEMLSSVRPDVLLAITPLERTVEIASSLLHAGAVLLVEKPPGLRPDETLSLAGVARESGCTHLVSFNRRFSPALNGALGWMASEGLSPPHHVAASMVRNRRREVGFVVGTGIHLIDTVCSILGAATELSVSRHSGEATDSFVSAVNFAGGATAHITIVPDSGDLQEEIVLYGDGYTVRLDMLAGSFEARRDGTVSRSRQVDRDADPRLADGTLDETRRLLALAAEKGGGATPSEHAFGARSITLLPTLEESYRSMVLASAIAEVRSGELSYKRPTP